VQFFFSKTKNGEMENHLTILELAKNDDFSA
jgi:hypothetical protein